MSVSAHAALSVQQFLTKEDINPPCPPSLFAGSHSERLFCCCFSALRKVLKRKRFADVEEVKRKMADALKGIKIHEFRNCFEQWKKNLNRCIASNSEYFEGD